MKNIEVQINKDEFKKKLGIPPVEVPEVVRNKLELLRGEERLDKSAIRGLDDYDEVKKKAFSKQVLVGGGGGTLDASRFVKKTGDTMTGDLRGTDFVPTRSFTVTRDGSGYLATIVKTGGRTVTITRNGSNYISSATDGTNTWTITRDGSNVLTGVTVS